MKVRIALAQINTIVGAIDINVKKINEYIARAAAAGVDIIAFPELSIPGYPPEDLLLINAFVKKNIEAIRDIRVPKEIIAIVGVVDNVGGAIFNAAAVMNNNQVIGKYHKKFLPNYGVFDEKRYFTAAEEANVFCANGFCFGVNICEDIWYSMGPAVEQKKLGADFIINISASPYHTKKIQDRLAIAKARVAEVMLPIVYVNMVGGQDELVFDGNSLIVDERGNLLLKAGCFEEELNIYDLNFEPVEQAAEGGNVISFEFLPNNSSKKLTVKPLKREISEEEEVYKALVVGFRDYFTKAGFDQCIIGLSGGIDSALTLAIAADAIGADKIICVSMPSQYSSEGTKIDARKIAANFGVRFHEVPIDNLFTAYLEEFEHLFPGEKRDVTEENIQARIRGDILMAIANKKRGMVVATGNKSELSMGYCTLYGDMVGGFAVLKDVYKTMVYRLSDYRNETAGFDIIPQSIISRAPSAELKENQKDSDTLPPYETLDEILYFYIEKNFSVEEIAALGFDMKEVKQVLETVDRNEYKRRQGPPGIKITKRAFGKDRRMPIINRFLR